MRKLIAVAAVLVSLALAGAWLLFERDEAPSLVLATTTSTRDSGLLDVLAPLFEKQSGVKVKIIAVGSGAALAMAETGDADALLVHAPEAERAVVASGDLVDGKLVMHNDYLIVGPAADPAGAKGAESIASAVKAIAGSGGFVSRGDDSGTHKKELSIWRAAGIELSAVKNREETGQGMGATLQIADQRGAYTLTDRGTYLAFKEQIALIPIYQGDKSLLNVYHVYAVNPQKHARVNAEHARAFVDFMVTPEAQETIGKFGVDRFGEPLFFPDAGKSESELGN